MIQTHTFRIGDKVRVHEAGASFDNREGLIRAVTETGFLIRFHDNTVVILGHDSLEYIGRD